MTKIFKEIFFTLIFAVAIFSAANAQRVWDVNTFHDGLARIQAVKTGQKGQYCFIDRTGKRVTDFYESASDFSEGVAVVEKDGKWCILDTTGKETVILNYRQVKFHGFSEGLLPVCQNGKWGYADKTGKLIIPCNYENAGIFYDGAAMVQRADKSFIYIDKTGKEVQKPEKKTDGADNELIMSEEEKGGYGYVDKNGKKVIPNKYSYAEPFKHGIACVSEYKQRGGYIRTGIDNGGFQTSAGEVRTQTITTQRVEGFAYHDVYFINRKGKKLGFSIQGCARDLIDGSSERYYDCNYSEGLWRVYKGYYKKWGFADENGNVVIPIKYDEVIVFCDGLAMVRTKGKWIFIDKKGKKVGGDYNDTMQFIRGSVFSEGLAIVSISGKWFIIDKQCNQVAEVVLK